MKLFQLLVVLLLVSGCSTNETEKKKYDDDDPKSLIGKWEILREYHDNQKIFDLTDPSQNYSDEVIKGMKNNYLHFHENGKITGGIWINRLNNPIVYTRKGIYKTDNGKLGIEIYHDNAPRPIGGTFKWKIRENYLYLYSINQKGSYQVYRRSE